MLVLGIDPGTATTGFGLVESRGSRLRAVDYGTISTPAGMDMPERLCLINQDLSRIISQYKPQSAAVEQIFYYHNAKTVITVAQSRGVILYTVASAGVRVCEYTPLQVKQSVVGYGQADKRQVQLMVQRILSLKEIPKPDDAADALAIAICHLHAQRLAEIYRSEL
ncbi:MAG TPA: crossover junction endodeoxyribonuclease RuvC [Syntrophomonadaceae bacterium]|nr:crossover junction endodeoxyribonuclease RuvC [Syntrophomonadaceae bacterium]